MKNQKAPKPAPPRVTIADRLLVAGQRLRANEVATPLTMRVGFAAKWIQAAGGAR
jgi:hypothetical protein